MNTYEINCSTGNLKELKRESQIAQKKGLPFIMSSVILWTAIAIIQLSDLDITTKNMYTFMCSAFLMPLAFMFSKLVRQGCLRDQQIRSVNLVSYVP